MDLDDWLYFEKKKNKEFSKKEFAKKVGIGLTNISAYLAGFKTFSAPMAYRIYKCTRGEVDVWALILKQQEAVQKRKEKPENED